MNAPENAGGPMRVLVCGGRDYQDKDAVWRALDALAEVSEKDPLGRRGVVIIHGACSTGADRFANQWAEKNWKDVEVFPADRKTRGGAAGPIRNKQMLDESKPDLVLAFPGGRGTNNMMRLAYGAGVEVRLCGHHGW